MFITGLTGIEKSDSYYKTLTIVKEFYDENDNYHSSFKPEFYGKYSSEYHINSVIENKKNMVANAFKKKAIEMGGIELLDSHIEREDRSHNVVILHVQIKIKTS